MTHKTSVTHQRLIYNCPLYLELRSDWSSYLQSQVKLLESCQLQLIIGRVALSPVRAECPPVYQAQSMNAPTIGVWSTICLPFRLNSGTSPDVYIPRDRSRAQCVAMVTVKTLAVHVSNLGPQTFN